jgi:hypothetical protein
MIAVSANAILWTLVAFAVALALIAVWRVAVRDRTTSRIRLGFFWEREREEDEPLDRELRVDPFEHPVEDAKVARDEARE